MQNVHARALQLNEVDPRNVQALFKEIEETSRNTFPETPSYDCWHFLWLFEKLAKYNLFAKS